MNYSKKSSQELLLMSIDDHDMKKIRKEWFTRFQVSFPYRVNAKGQIINGFTDEEVPEDECDKLILQQVKALKSKRGERVKDFLGHYVG